MWEKHPRVFAYVFCASRVWGEGFPCGAEALGVFELALWMWRQSLSAAWPFKVLGPQQCWPHWLLPSYRVSLRRALHPLDKLVGTLQPGWPQASLVPSGASAADASSMLILKIA